MFLSLFLFRVQFLALIILRFDNLLDKLGLQVFKISLEPLLAFAVDFLSVFVAHNLFKSLRRNSANLNYRRLCSSVDNVLSNLLWGFTIQSCHDLSPFFVRVE